VLLADCRHRLSIGDGGILVEPVTCGSTIPIWSM
jgi:hypothetical protein